MLIKEPDEHVSGRTQELLGLADEALLDHLQHAAFDYFLATVNPKNGLVSDTTRPNSPCSIAVVGFALSCYPIAVERGWLDRAKAIQLTLAALRFFHSSEQSVKPDATGYKGFYYHFLDMKTGRRVWHCELSMIDTAILIAGMLTAAQYFQKHTQDETEIRERAQAMYLRADWRWSQGGEATIRMGWKPECGYLHYGWDGYSEAIILYALAMGSPSHPVSDACYKAWTLTYQWENLYSYDFLYAGPLFIHQFSHAWIDFRRLRDAFMREKTSDYFENSRRAVEVQRRYCEHNPDGFTGYDRNCWGLTACDGPQQDTRQFYGYAARGVPYGPDDGTLAGSAVLASLPFAPEAVMTSVRAMLERYPEMLPQDRYASSFNPSLADIGQPAWISYGHFGLDQGIVVMMVENYRSELIWRLMRNNVHLAHGLRRAGFRGGWLNPRGEQ